MSNRPVNVQPQLVDQLRFLLGEAEAGRIHQGVFIAHGIDEERGSKSPILRPGFRPQ